MRNCCDGFLDSLLQEATRQLVSLSFSSVVSGLMQFVARGNSYMYLGWTEVLGWNKNKGVL